LNVGTVVSLSAKPPNILEVHHSKQDYDWRKSMSNANNRIKSQKKWPAVLAALVMTAIIGLAILALGANALLNSNVTPVQAANLPDQSLSVDQSSVNQVAADQATIEQLQNLVEQYQARELQYQSELQQAADQLDQTNAELQQYQGVVNALQESGVIQISRNGRVFLNQGLFSQREHEFGEDD